jgi:GNAT superfamily N-acetyltransferase
LPEAQGKGVGRALMEEVLAMADREGVECYLESSRRVPNVEIYEKFGFELAKEMECRDGEGEKDAVMLYCMTRTPKTGNSADDAIGTKTVAAKTAGTTPDIGQ